MKNVKTMDQSRAEAAAYNFAKDHKLSVSDPIVRNLESGLKMSLGLMRHRDQIKAQRDAMQPGLFPNKPGKVVSFKVDADTSAAEGGK